uniref:Putative ixostatin n=1 Tax=Ixodes ricinus TaxID=34613 RepID=A0A0K8RKZ0_IXORI
MRSSASESPTMAMLKRKGEKTEPPGVPLPPYSRPPDRTPRQLSQMFCKKGSSSRSRTSANHKVYNACTIIPNGTYYANLLAVNTSAEWHLYEYCYFIISTFKLVVTGTALKVNRCCRVCCRVTVSLGRISRHYLMDQKVPYGFPCGPNKICDRDQACIVKPNETIEIEQETERRHDVFVNETSWYSEYS